MKIFASNSMLIVFMGLISCSNNNKSMSHDITNGNALEDKSISSEPDRSPLNNSKVIDILQQCNKCELLLKDQKLKHKYLYSLPSDFQTNNVPEEIKEFIALPYNKRGELLQDASTKRADCIRDWRNDVGKALVSYTKDQEERNNFIDEGMKKYCGYLYNYFYPKEEVQYKTKEEMEAEFQECNRVGNKNAVLPAKSSYASYFTTIPECESTEEIVSYPVTITLEGQSYTFSIEKCKPKILCDLKGDKYYDHHGEECRCYIMRMKNGPTSRWMLLARDGYLDILKMKKILLGAEEALLLYGEDNCKVCAQSKTFRNILIIRIDKKKSNAYIYLKIADDSTSEIPECTCGEGNDCNAELVDINNDSKGEIKITNGCKGCVIIKQDKKKKYLWKGEMKGIKYKKIVELHGYMHLIVYDDENLEMSNTIPEI